MKTLEQTQQHEPEILDLEDEKSFTTITHEFSNGKKWFLLMIVSLQGFLGPLSSSIYVPAIAQVRDTFQTNETTINTTISLYVFFQGIAPLGWASISEKYGCRIVYIASSFLYVVATIGCALSPSVGFFIFVRIFQSIGSSASQAVGARTITDLFTLEKRGKAMGWFFMGTLLGPVVGPVIGGYMNQYLDWRYMFWLMTGVGGLVFLMVVAFLPETMKQKASGNFMHVIRRPFEYLGQSLVFCVSMPLMLAYGFMYFVIASLPHQFITQYGFSSAAVGLAYLPNGIGNAVGALMSGAASDRLVKRHLQQHNENNDALASPRKRLVMIWIGILVMATGNLVYGWCIQYQVTVAVSMVGLFLLGFGVGIIQSPTNTFLVDVYYPSSASVISASNMMRCTFAGLTPLVAPTMLASIGNGWSMTVLASILFASGLCVLLATRLKPKV